ncbi:3-alpha-hydroxysteroid dehydrogenase [Nocardia wallacei]|uniref:3-alpha-hydroxysteroid dehydrogenase n=1 Tax=Nocardia wallacei TaxID=480035 RepID=A0A7G1KI28_9NOCA|nr:3-alpha-hydroxysteroid dehydrogenase [Nocardia wallacei]
MPDVGRVEELWRYDGRRVVVTGCASGIGACVVEQVRELGGEVVGLDIATPATELDGFHQVDMSDAASIDRAVEAVGGPVDALFNVAGVSSGIGDPLRVVTINFLGLRRFTDALTAAMAPGSTVVSVSSLAAAGYLEHREQALGLVGSTDMADGIAWCEGNPEALADGGYRLSKEAIIYYTMRQAVPLGARGIRINCTGPGVTETPILDQLRSRYGPQYLDTIPKPLGRVCEPDEQAAVLVFLNSRAASYVTGQVLWVDGGNVAARITEGELWPA